MELLQLRYFYDCARYGSIVKTAEKYMVPPSSVSASIRRLEGELENTLFDRTSNRIVLNENGIRLKKALDKVFSELDQTVADITCPVGEQRIKLLVRTMRERATEYIIEYRKLHPNVIFEFVMAFDNVEFTDFDVIIDVYSDKYANYEWFDLRQEQVRFCVSLDHPLAGKDLTLKQLKGQNFVTMGGNIHAFIENACQDAGFTPNVVAQVNDIACYRKLMRSGIAIGYRRDRADNASEGLCYLNVTDFKQIQRMCVYYRKDTSGPVENFVEYLRTKCI
jgi:DNA-binding transcriptional LysR family regulator